MRLSLDVNGDRARKEINATMNAISDGRNKVKELKKEMRELAPIPRDTLERASLQMSALPFSEREQLWNVSPILEHTHLTFGHAGV